MRNNFNGAYPDGSAAMALIPRKEAAHWANILIEGTD